MSGNTTTPATTTDGGLTEDQTIIIAVVCGVAGLIIIAVILRFLMPCCRGRKKRNEADDRSLVHATTSVGSDQHFYYSGPVVPERQPVSDTQTERTIITREEQPMYINVAREEFESNPVWISGPSASRQISREVSPVREESRHTETIVRQEYRQETNVQEDSPRLGHHSRQTSSNLELGMFQGSPRPARYTRQDVIRQESPRVQRVVREERVVRQESPRLHREVHVRDTNPRLREVYHEYDIPPKNPREVRRPEARHVPNSVPRDPLREVPPLNVVRMSEYSREKSWSGVRNDNQATETPVWMHQALMISDPGFITRSVAPPPGSTIAPSMANGNRRVLTREEITGFQSGKQSQLSAQEMLNNRKYLNYSTREDWIKDEEMRRQQEKYEHFSQQNPPGRREVYHLGRDAMRTPELREYIKRDKHSSDFQDIERRTQTQHPSYPANGHVTRGNYRPAPVAPSASRGGKSEIYTDRAYRRNQEAPVSKPNGFVPVNPRGAPSKLPSEYNREHRNSIETADQLNRELTTYLLGSPLRPLDMSSKYRENWDNQYDPYGLQDRALNHFTHPSENPAFPEPETKEWHRIHEERLAQPPAPIKGKKGKGKAK